MSVELLPWWLFTAMLAWSAYEIGRTDATRTFIAQLDQLLADIARPRQPAPKQAPSLLKEKDFCPSCGRLWLGFTHCPKCHAPRPLTPTGS